MHNRSSSKLSRDQTSNPASSTNPTPKGQIHRSSKQKVKNSNFEEHLTPVATMTDNRTMAEMLRAPTEGCAEVIVVPPILAEQFELKHSLINMMTPEQLFGLEKDNTHDHIRWGSLLQKFDESFHEAWERYKDLFRACPHHGFTKLYQLDTFYNALNPADQDSLNAAVGGNLLEKSPQDALTIIENNSKVHNSRSKPIASPVNAYDINSSSEIAKLTHVVNQQTSAVTTAMTAMLKQLQANPPPAQVTVVEDIHVTCGGAHPYYQCLAIGGNTFSELWDNIQCYVSVAAGNYNKGNPGYRPQGVANQMRPLGSGSFPGNTIANPKGKPKAITTHSGLATDGPTVPTSPKSINPEEDECVEETYTDPDLAEYTIKVPPPPALVLMPKYQKMLKALLSNKEKLQELANTPLNENCSAIILKKLPEKLGDPGFSELKCKALADLGASINLIPLCAWKNLGLPDLIPTRMTLELANRAICTPDGIARDVFVPVGKPFLRTTRALIDVNGEEMILRDGDERLTLNMKHDTASYSNHPHRDSVNLINIFNIPSEDCLEDLVSNKQSGNPTFSLHKEIASPKVTHELHDSEGCTFLSKELPDIDSFNDIHPHFDDDPLSGSTTYSSNSLLEEFTDELALITYPLDYDDNHTCDIESDLKEKEFFLYQGDDFDLKYLIDQTDLANLDDLFVDPTPEMFTDEHAPDYSLPLRFDVYPGDLLEIEFDADNFDDDSFDSKGEKIKEAELLIDQLDFPCDILPYPEYDSFNSQDFSKDDDLPSPDNEDKVFNPRILIQEKSVKIITRVAQEKKLSISYAFLLFEDFDPLFYELLVFKEVPNSMRLLLFSSKNEEKVFKPGIYTSEKVKEYQEKDKIGSKLDKNKKHGEARKSQKQLQSIKKEKLKKMQKEGPEMQMGIRRVVPRNYNPKGERFLTASRFPTPLLTCSFFSLRATVTSSSKLSRDQTSNPTSSTNPTPKGRIRRSSKQKVENSNFEEHLTPVATMTDNRTMAEMLRAPTEGCAEAIVVPLILAEQFDLKHSLINMMTPEQLFRLEKDNPHDHIHWFNKIASTIKYKDSPNSVIKLYLFPFSLAGATHRWLEKEPPRSIATWDDLVSKFINEFFPPLRATNLRNEFLNFQQKFDESFHEAWERYKDLLRACPYHDFTELHQLDTFYNALNPSDQDSLNAAAGCNLLEKSLQDALTIIKNNSKVRNSRRKLIASPVTAVEEICVTCGGAHPYYQCLAAGGNTFPEFWGNIQGYVSAATCNYNQGNPCYRPQGAANQMRPPGFAQPNVQNNQNRFGQPQGFNRSTNFYPEQPYQATAQSNQNFHLNELEKIKRINDVSLKAMQNQVDMVKNKLRNEMKTSIHTSLSNQTNEIKNMMASLLQMNTTSTSGLGSFPGNTIANPKGKPKAITTRSGLVTDGPTVPTSPKSVNQRKMNV
nr:reverse transcriptase domain-containing protein [Tanacetum cinerariifolium]